jgi:hypothetical protein
LEFELVGILHGAFYFITVPVDDDVVSAAGSVHYVLTGLQIVGLVYEFLSGFMGGLWWTLGGCLCGSGGWSFVGGGAGEGRFRRAQRTASYGKGSFCAATGLRERHFGYRARGSGNRLLGGRRRGLLRHLGRLRLRCGAFGGRRAPVCDLDSLLGAGLFAGAFICRLKLIGARFLQLAFVGADFALHVLLA